MNLPKNPDTVRAIIIAEDVDDMLDMYKAAERVDGSSVEALRLDSDEHRRKAVEAYRNQAIALNGRSHNGLCNPEEWAERARASLQAGGYLVALNAEATPDRTALTNISLFRTALRGIQRPDQSVTMEPSGR